MTPAAGSLPRYKVVAGGGCDARASLPLRHLRPEKAPPRVAPRAFDGCWHSATRLLSRDECLAYAQTMRLTHIGSTTDEAEFPGCVVWQEKHVEFNERGSAAAGCESVERNHGRTVCAQRCDRTDVPLGRCVCCQSRDVLFSLFISRAHPAPAFHSFLDSTPWPRTTPGSGTRSRREAPSRRGRPNPPRLVPLAAELR